MFPFTGLLSGRFPATALPAFSELSTDNWPGLVRAGIRFETNGNLTRIYAGGESDLTPDFWADDFWEGNIDASKYECGLFNITGDTAQVQGPALGAWHPISVAREWKIETTSKFGVFSIAGDYSVRPITQPLTVTTNTISLATNMIFE